MSNKVKLYDFIVRSQIKTVFINSYLQVKRELAGVLFEYAFLIQKLHTGSSMGTRRQVLVQKWPLEGSEA